MYSARLLDHFHNPRHAGEIENATAVVESTNPVCGDVLKLWVAVVGGRIADAKFKAAGCVPAIACGSWLAEHLHGKALSALQDLQPAEIETALDGLPAASKHAAALAAETLRKLLEAVRR